MSYYDYILLYYLYCLRYPPCPVYHTHVKELGDVTVLSKQNDPLHNEGTIQVHRLRHSFNFRLINK